MQRGWPPGHDSPVAGGLCGRLATTIRGAIAPFIAPRSAGYTEINPLSGRPDRARNGLFRRYLAAAPAIAKDRFPPVSDVAEVKIFASRKNP